MAEKAMGQNLEEKGLLEKRGEAQRKMCHLRVWSKENCPSRDQWVSPNQFDILRDNSKGGMCPHPKGFTKNRGRRYGKKINENGKNSFKAVRVVEPKITPKLVEGITVRSVGSHRQLLLNLPVLTKGGQKSRLKILVDTGAEVNIIKKGVISSVCFSRLSML